MTTLHTDLLAQLSVAHHIPGRLRLKAEMAGLQTILTTADQSEKDSPPISGAGIDAVVSFLDQLRMAPGVRAIRVNNLARSCTIGYDTAVIPPEAWNDLLAGQKTPEASALLDTLVSVAESVKSKDR